MVLLVSLPLQHHLLTSLSSAPLPTAPKPRPPRARPRGRRSTEAAARPLLPCIGRRCFLWPRLSSVSGGKDENNAGWASPEPGSLVHLEPGQELQGPGRAGRAPGEESPQTHRSSYVTAQSPFLLESPGSPLPTAELRTRAMSH